MPSLCAVTGNMQTLSGSGLPQGTVNFQLMNLAIGTIPQVTGTALLPQTLYKVQTAIDGSFMVNLWGNDNILPVTTFYGVTFRDVSGNELGPILFYLTGSFVNLNSLAAISGGALAIQSPTITNPTITGTVSGGATYSGITLTSPSLTTPTITSPVINGLPSGNVTLLTSQGPKSPIPGNGADQIIYSYTVGGGVMAAGKGIRVTCVATHSAGTASVSYKFSFGGTTSSAFGFTDNTNVKFVSEVFNQSLSITAQTAAILGTGSSSSVYSAGTLVILPTENTASNVLLKMTFNVANTDTVIPQLFVVELIQ